jgi:glutamate carboxypeptidase
VTFLVTSDEETGSASSRQVIEDEARRSAAVLVLEPSLPGGAVKTSRKGCGQYAVRTRGIAAHAGIEPEKGASAIHDLARLIALIVSWQDTARGLTINVGTVTGGTRPNVVAESAESEVDVRVAAMTDADRIDALMRGLRSSDPRVTLEVTGGFDRPPLERTAGVAALYAQAKEVAAELGRELGEGGTGGGSDGNLTAAIGVPTLDGLGAVGGGAHAVGEYVDAAELPWRAALVAGLLRRILAS